VSVKDLGDILARIEPLIFRLDIPEGDDCYGTGFFISSEFAVTAFHNLYASVLESPTVPLSATFQGKTIDFVQALCSEQDRKWQIKYDIAVLRAVMPLNEPINEKFLYLDAGWERRERNLKWEKRNVIAFGIPANTDQIAPIAGMTILARPLVDAPRKIGPKVEGTIPAALYFTADANDVNNAYGMSGSPVYDEELRGIIGVVVAVKKGYYATELVHLVKNWPAGRKYFEDFEPRSTVVAEETAVGKPSWWLRLGIGILCAAIALGSVFWLTSVRSAPKQLEVELVREATKGTEIVNDQINAKEGEKLRLLITSPTDGYLYVVDREVARNGSLREPYLAFPTLSTGAGHNKVTPGLVVSFPDPSDRSLTVEAKPSHPPDPEYTGELLSILVFENQLPIDHLEAQPIPLTPEQFPDGGERLLFSSEAPAPKAAKKIKLVVLRTSQTPRPEVTRPR
jgi:hypothetical protein